MINIDGSRGNCGLDEIYHIEDHEADEIGLEVYQMYADGEAAALYMF
jgi:hypothetical protein